MKEKSNIETAQILQLKYQRYIRYADTFLTFSICLLVVRACYGVLDNLWLQKLSIFIIYIKVLLPFSVILNISTRYFLRKKYRDFLSSDIGDGWGGDNCWSRLDKISLFPEFSGMGFLLCCVYVLSSSLSAMKYSFMIDDRAFIYIALIFVFFLLLNKKYQPSFSFKYLLLFQAFVAFVFFEYSSGRMVFSDDHPSFFYRLALLDREFPNIPFYNLDWNAGYMAREFFPSGILNVFFLSYPIIRYFNFSQIDYIDSAFAYNSIIAYCFIILAPLSIYFSVRVLRFSPRAAVISGILALAPGIKFFEWLLAYGTLGFCMSAALAPLCFSLAWSLAFYEKDDSKVTTKLLPFLLAVVFSLMLFWSLSFLALVPLTIIGVLYVVRVWRLGNLRTVFYFGIIAALLNFSWVSIFLDHSPISAFVGKDAMPGQVSATELSKPSLLDKFKELDSSELKTEIRKKMISINPICFLLAFPGFYFLFGKNKFLFFGVISTVGFLLFLATFGQELKPQLELKRMVVVVSFFMALFAGVGADLVLKKKEGKYYNLLSSSFVSAMILFSIFSATRTYENKSMYKYSFAPKELAPLSQSIKNNLTDGRVFFLGFILHELGASTAANQDGGHIAPLPIWTGADFYAHDFYHVRWSKSDPIPKEYRKRGREGVEEFLDMLNVKVVITFLAEWRDYCQADKERYEEVGKYGRFRVFKRKTNSTYFSEGQGKVSVLQDRVRVIPNSDEVVIKFRYLSRLKLGPSDAAHMEGSWAYKEESKLGGYEDVNFIRLKSIKHKGSPIDIFY